MTSPDEQQSLGQHRAGGDSTKRAASAVRYVLERWPLLATLFVPVLAMAGLMLHRQVKSAEGVVWTFEIAGFDPVDLVRGHYLQFRLRLDYGEGADGVRERVTDWIDTQVDRADEALGDTKLVATNCLCLTGARDEHGNPSSTPPLVRNEDCEVALRECDGAIDKRFMTELERFYIPEERAAEWDQRVRDATQRGTAFARVRVTRNGSAHVDNVVVDGVLVKDDSKK